ncbi:MFS transporter [Oerskovia flava]|uniref:MFS transporter n=1 Tax=Oerskovia flava TaxID=2986422 RepID=UPI00223F75B5|nr:MFS transporter [Oerskovia sp. JB1-3-2]
MTRAALVEGSERVGLGRWRAALVVAFFGTGLGMATWVTRTPSIRDVLGASTAEMGLIIAGLSVGSVIGIGVGGLLVARRGARFVVACGMSAIVAGVLVVGLGAGLSHGLVVATGLALFGYGMGSGEIGLNVEGVELEVAVGRSVVPGLHGCFSLGIFVGGLAGLAANAAAVPVLVHMATVTLLVGAGTVWLVGQLPARTGATARTSGADPMRGAAVPRGQRWPWFDARLLALAAIILGMALAEGSANDWLPLIVVDGYGLSESVGALVYAFFGLSMAVGRLTGGRVIDRFGRAPVMRTSAVVAAAGIAMVSFAPGPWLAAVGVLLWGLGASLGFPVALSAAGDDPEHAAKRASAVATAGYAAFLVGPPILGLLGEQVGLRAAILVVMVAVLATTLFSGAVRERPSPTHREDPS